MKTEQVNPKTGLTPSEAAAYQVSDSGGAVTPAQRALMQAAHDRMSADYNASFQGRYAAFNRDYPILPPLVLGGIGALLFGVPGAVIGGVVGLVSIIPSSALP